MGKHNAYSYLYFYKILDDQLYTISPDHVVRADIDQLVNISLGQMKLDGETFKLLREIT